MTRKAGKTAEEAAKVKTPVQEALEVTWRLKGDLKRAQLAYLRIGAELVHVRDAGLFAALHHPDLETYAEQRLGLGKRSLYRYLQVYDWVSRNHPEWLQPKAKGFIPDLSDAAGLMWLESELARPDMSTSRKAGLLELKKKALAGQLTARELEAFRRKGQPATDAVKAYLSGLRLMRRKGGKLASLPPEVLAHLDSAIDILANDHTQNLAGLHFVLEKPVRGYSSFVA